MIESKKFLEIINLLELNYDKKLDKRIVKIWYDEFKNYNEDVFRKCVIEAIKNEYFFPTINKVKEFKNKNIEYVDEQGVTWRNGKRVL